MAIFPEGNPGEYPVDMTKPVGVFRAVIGDTESTPYDPEEPGFQNFEMFSDAEITGFLAAGNDNLNRGVGYAYLALAGRAAIESKSIKDFDLSIDNTKRPTELRLIAQSWFDKADKEDAASQDAFFVAPLGGDCGDPIAEGMMPTWGRYAVGRWSC